MLCEPPVSDEVSQGAMLLPAPAVRGPELEQAKAVLPSAKATEPVGTMSPATPVSVAVKVKAVPKTSEEEEVVGEGERVGAAVGRVWATGLEEEGLAPT